MTTNVATLALGLRLGAGQEEARESRQRGRKGANQKEARESKQKGHKGVDQEEA